MIKASSSIKILVLVLTFMLILTSSATCQETLPTIGSIDDIKGLSKVYLIANAEARKAILKQFEKQKDFSVVDNPGAAEFFIEYKTISRQPFDIAGTTETGQLDVFVYRDKQKVIAWSESTTGGGFKGDTANRLIKKFFKVYRKGNSQTQSIAV